MVTRADGGNTWTVDPAALSGISIRFVTVSGSLAAAGFSAVIAIGDLTRSPLWTVVVWCSTAVALALAAVVGVSRRALGRSGASVFVAVADLAIAACVAALADPLAATVLAAGTLAILGNFAVFYTPMRVFITHLIVSAAITGVSVAQMHLDAEGVLVAVIALWLSVGMHPLTRRLWDDAQRNAAVAFLDPLTATTNRAGLERNVAHLHADMRRRRRSVAVAVVDLDRFKQVNDTWGHAVGDAVLAETARHLHRHFGPEATVSRSGGEEFVVVVSGTRDDVVRLVETFVPATPGETAPPVGMSVGVVWCALTCDDALDDAIRLADTVMYAAKRDGGRCIYSRL